ncbi:MAG: ATP-binding protein [Alphaproteobacteria bacterium]|nr:ATP-binding protein [Alphaproteobacteria bacterium]
MARLHIIEGPVGAGKTTFAAHLSRQCNTPALVLDEWMVTLFRPDRPADDLWRWYAERKQRCIEQIWRVVCGLMDTGNDAIVELGLVQRRDRIDLYRRAESGPYEYVVHVLDAPVAVRRDRVRNRNLERGPTFSMDVPDAVFEMASEMWEPFDSAECTGRNVQFVKQTVRSP